MNERTTISWQTMMADLSLVLFMITAAAMSQAGESKARAQPVEASPQAEPLAVYRTGRNAPPLGQWLAGQTLDPRQQVTIISSYRPGGQAEALALAGTLAREAGDTGRAARIVIEPGEGGAAVTLAYDIPPADLARSLQASGKVKPSTGR